MKTFRLIRFLISISFLTVILFTITLAAKPLQQEPKAKYPGGVDPQNLQLNNTPEPELNQSGMVDLFNGKDLTGWIVKGGKMPFTVSNGEIVGTCDPEVRLNSFLVTDKSYGDFIFTAEYKWDVLSNSGVMFRADSRSLEEGERPVVTDRSLLQVYGYQCEVETSERQWTGGIYGEAMGGWKYPLSKDVEHAKARLAVQDHKGWTRITIFAKGDHLLTWINGVPCSNLTNQERTSGFFGLQVHQGQKGQIRWRNIRVKVLAE